jgi:UPF0716 protein FxsA
MTTSAPPPQAPQQRRSRARTILPLAVAAWAVLEIWLLIVVARAAGGFTVLLLLVAGFVFGAMAAKRAGRSAWRSLAESMQPAAGTGPAEDGVREKGGRGAGLAMLGGLLLMVPGFLSDAVGLLCLFPPTRALLRKAGGRALDRRRAAYDPGSLGDLFQQARTADEQLRIHRPDGRVIQGEVVERDGDVSGNDENPGSRR